MKKGLVFVFVLFTTACTSIGDMPMFGKNSPKVLSGDDSQVLLYDAIGVNPAAGEATAKKYCASYGKTAEWKSRGGSDPDCISMQMNYCVTYLCK
ncbi:MAG TPA: hypothetical protein VN809_05595 [Telmatospirillum sp.]|nr:hypothetical protein [Telmatospirillum sp.]